MHRDPGPVEDQGGFAVVDALVAVTILSSSLALSLSATQIGVRASRAAGETRDAELVLRDHLEGVAGKAGAWSGHEQGLDWRVTSTPIDVPRRGLGLGLGLAGPCQRTAVAKAARSGRVYRIATIDICRIPAPTAKGGA